MSKHIDHLLNHDFSKSVLENANKVNQEYTSEEDFLSTEPELTETLSEGDYYFLECGTSYTNLISLFEQLIHIPAYLKEYERTNSMASKSITRFHYTKYHLENFIIRTRSFEDRALQLGSAVAHTGIDKSDINFRSVTRNVHVKSSGIKNNLSEIHNICDEYSSDRNEIIHQRNLIDEDLKEIEFMLLSSRFFEEHRNLTQAEYRRLIQEFAKEKVPEIKEFNSKLEKATIKLFDTLLSTYNKWKYRLSL